MDSPETARNRPDSAQKSLAPAISLPKGGGAIRGIGEKFAANPVSGTGSMSVPIACSPGRAGFGPQLSLNYDSGAGNGPFGFGWSLALPQITRKTDKGLPLYHDAQESDVFVLSGAEDLVPVAVEQNGTWAREALPDRTVGAHTYTIQRYRPRIEGLFARIERWTRHGDGDVHWRSISKDNILSLYGKDANSRIADPADPLRVFTWLICETRDDKGNAMVYDYKAEDGAGVDVGLAHERNRGDRDDARRAANRYPKRIRYGNRLTMLDAAGQRPPMLNDTQRQGADWMFEVVFDYGEHDPDVPKPDDAAAWTHRIDPFSSYRAGFEVRTSRLCRRVLMFHHFPGEPGVGADCLVRSTDFGYSHQQHPANVRNPAYSFLLSVSQSGYKRSNGGYLKRSLPPVEYQYTEAVVQDTVREVDAASLRNLPTGVDGTAYQWTDLHGEGIPGILTEQGGAWFYKRNVSPISERPVEFAPLERVAVQPNLALAGGQAQFLDLAGDGQPDLVVLEGASPGFYEHDGGEGWHSFRPFTARLNRSTLDPNLKFIDLDGDGHADVLISEDDAFIWHASLAEEGFGPARRVHQALDEEKGPRLVLADGTESIYLADMAGDGLTDLVRIRNGDVCYWPNLGYGRFGAKVTMDGAPHFDDPDHFDHKRIRLADIDGTGTTDLIYLHRNGVRLYFNQSGNSWSEAQHLKVFPQVNDLVSIAPTDLFGNGTACLVWSSPLPGDTGGPMRYVDLMGGHKPHLLIKSVNNLGAETIVSYAPSTKFYLRDKRDGNPWLTKLPFPVHVVERVESHDYISRSHFVSCYAYHHGHFDPVEREFRGFGMVEQWDTEAFGVLGTSDVFPVGDNIDAASHVPPVHTKTWFHTGALFDRIGISSLFDGLLEDSVLPVGLSAQELREACRALKGEMLRQEVYALDGTPKAKNPYILTEETFTVRRLQPKGEGRHAVFFAHARESISHHFERNPADPRISHELTLEVDAFGNVRKELAIDYGRRQPDPGLPSQADRDAQGTTFVTCTENDVTNAIDDPLNSQDDYRTPLPSATRTYELTGFEPTRRQDRFTVDEWVDNDFALLKQAAEIDYDERAVPGQKQKRLIEHELTLYRKNDLTDLLAPHTVESLALEGESYKLALTSALARRVYSDSGKLGAVELDHVLAVEGGYVHGAGDSGWWIASGRVFFSPGSADTQMQELAHARAHFFLPCRYRNPFQTESFVSYDAHDLLMVETRDALGNVTTVATADDAGSIAIRNDYRTLQPSWMTDPNGNRIAVAFDALGMVTGTAVMGKPLPAPVEGDSLEGFEPDLSEIVIRDHLANPLVDPKVILGRATTRLVYDLFAYQRTKDQLQPHAAVVYALVRETHDADAIPDGGLKFQHSFSYSDGFGRAIQVKKRAEAGRVPMRNADGSIIVGADGRPQLTQDDVSPRWTGDGWTVFNNKGDPVRQYEPFFTDTHRFEFDVRIGVSPVLFYDPLGRLVAALHPNHTWEKRVFDAWRQKSWDVSDTVLANDPRIDPDVGEFFRRLPAAEYLPTWHSLRQGGALGPHEQDAARQAAVHAETPGVAYADSLGRSFLAVTHNKFKFSGTPAADPPTEEFHRTRVVFDIEGNECEVIDAKGRVVMRYDYDLLGTCIHYASMEAGKRWMLEDTVGRPIRAWDSRGHALRTEYDALRRPLRSFVRGADPQDPGSEILFGTAEYGEGQPDDMRLNLRTRAFREADCAGVGTSEGYDFKGNLLRSSRRLVRDYHRPPNWLAGPQLEGTFTSSTRYDALNRPLAVTGPDASVYRPDFGEANLLKKVDVHLRGAAEATPFVTDIDYDAKGQRTRIVYGNGVRTVYERDPLTFRLMRLLTTRPGGANGLATALFRNAGTVQDLNYTYDPAGNIVRIADDALPTIFFANQSVEPVNAYGYDAAFRLIEAHGRESIGQSALQLGLPQSTLRDYPHAGLGAQPFDPKAVRNYSERYEYDEAGNFMHMSHQAHNGAWQREYRYREQSLLEPAAFSNRLTATVLHPNGSQPLQEDYAHDVHGNMTAMRHLTRMEWDFKDQLQASSRQVVNNGVPETTYYVYDDSGQRVRKVTERQNGTRKSERIYLGGFEVYREYDGGGSVPTLERETLHVTDNTQRIALVETTTLDGSTPAADPVRVLRYQFGNHLGSASLELDDSGQIIAYEEFYPYGTTSYQAGRSHAEASLKRYRYTGMERDEETGFCYHGARYLAAWLGRWTSCDPMPLNDGPNLFAYVLASPAVLVDSTGHGPEHQQLGARLEDTSKQHTKAVNKRRRQTGRGRIKVDPQRRVTGPGKVTIPDEVKTQPGKHKRKTVVELKGRHTAKKRNLDPVKRQADIKSSLNQLRDQLVALEAKGKITPQTQGKVLRVMYDKDLGKTATAARADWKAEAKAVREAWVNEATTPAEKALRERCNVVTTTSDRFSKAMKQTELNTRAAKGGKGPGMIGGAVVLLDLAGDVRNKDYQGAVKNVAALALMTKFPVVGHVLLAKAFLDKSKDPELKEISNAAGDAARDYFGSDIAGGITAATVHVVITAAAVAWDMVPEVGKEIVRAAQTSPGSLLTGGSFTPFVLKPLHYQHCFAGAPCSYR